MILLTGGTGYIGSHMAATLAEGNMDYVIFDNLSNSKAEVIQRLQHITQKHIHFVEGDIRDEAQLDALFGQYPIQSVIHFAGLKAVGESMQKPLQYFEHNIGGSITLFKAMKKAGVFSLVFSSSATVYGENDNPEFIESMPTGIPTNNYGYTKLIIEQLLQKEVLADPRWSIALLRYFNPIGAHPSGMIGEDPQGLPNNLLPFVLKVASGELDCLNIFGHDYPTADGTAIRDYLHVMDLAHGHLKALQYIRDKTGCFVWNLGTGQGSSVLDIVQQFEQVTGQKVNYRFAPRRAGDIAQFWANADKAHSELGWQAQHSLKQMIEDSWRWQMFITGQ